MKSISMWKNRINEQLNGYQHLQFQTYWIALIECLKENKTVFTRMLSGPLVPLTGLIVALEGVYKLTSWCLILGIERHQVIKNNVMMLWWFWVIYSSLIRNRWHFALSNHGIDQKILLFHSLAYFNEHPYFY